MDLAKKLQIKPGMRLKVAGAPKDFDDLLAPLPAGTKLQTRGKVPFDGAIVFCNNSADVTTKAVDAVTDVSRDGLLWLCYPKSSSGIKTDISRDKGWDPIYTAGLRPVRAISIDDTWSALRWRPREMVKSR